VTSEERPARRWMSPRPAFFPPINQNKQLRGGRCIGHQKRKTRPAKVRPPPRTVFVPNTKAPVSEKKKKTENPGIIRRKFYRGSEGWCKQNQRRGGERNGEQEGLRKRQEKRFAHERGPKEESRGTPRGGVAPGGANQQVGGKKKGVAPRQRSPLNPRSSNCTCKYGRQEDIESPKTKPPPPPTPPKPPPPKKKKKKKKEKKERSHPNSQGKSFATAKLPTCTERSPLLLVEDTPSCWERCRDATPPPKHPQPPPPTPLPKKKKKIEKKNQYPLGGKPKKITPPVRSNPRRKKKIVSGKGKVPKNGMP